MNDINVFFYKDLAFMHILESLIQRVRALMIADFVEHQDDAKYQAHDGHVHPDVNPSPLKLFVSIL